MTEIVDPYRMIEMGRTNELDPLGSALEELAYETEGFRSSCDPHGIELPYDVRGVTRILYQLRYNPKYGDNRTCDCGHPYHRHFDGYDNNFPIGCKYCSCHKFSEKINAV